MRLSKAVVAAVTALAVTSAVTSPASGASNSLRPPLGSLAGSYTDWPQLGGTPGHSGLTSDPAISTTTASGLGVDWMTQSLGPALASPVVSYSAALGETLVYSANEAGEIEAMNLANGQIVWSYQTFHQIVATPLVVDGALWVATQIQPKMIKLNADTGALDCTLPVQNQLMASPTYGVGPGGQLTIYEGEMDGSAAPQLGPMLAINAANCALDFSSFPEPTGVATGPWDPIAYGVDAGGRALAIMGTSNPDDSVYAVDAVTGAAVWLSLIHI